MIKTWQFVHPVTKKLITVTEENELLVNKAPKPSHLPKAVKPDWLVANPGGRPPREIPYGLENVKWCSKCSNWQDKSMFFRNSSNKNGLSTYCKLCVKLRNEEKSPEEKERRSVNRHIYYQINSAKIKERRHLRFIKFREYDYANASKYRVKKAGNSGSHTAGEWEWIKFTQGYTCLKCGEKEPVIKLTKDHIIPVSKGGTDNIGNIQGLCKSCNSSKSSKFEDLRVYKKLPSKLKK